VSAMKTAAGSNAADAMDRMYRWQRAIYDVTRRPYLLGRDCLVAELAPPAGGAVLEIGCGTGRNLVVAARAWPRARFFGYDVSAVMLDQARASVARAGLGERIALGRGDATAFDPHAAFGVAKFDRIYFSYVLSMIPEWRAALEDAAALLQPGCALSVVDFGDMAALPAPARGLLRRWLALFDVTPRVDLTDAMARIAQARGLVLSEQHPYRRYAVLATLSRPD